MRARHSTHRAADVRLQQSDSHTKQRDLAARPTAGLVSTAAAVSHPPHTNKQPAGGQHCRAPSSRRGASTQQARAVSGGALACPAPLLAVQLRLSGRASAARVRLTRRCAAAPMQGEVRRATITRCAPSLAPPAVCCLCALALAEPSSPAESGRHPPAARPQTPSNARTDSGRSGVLLV